MPAKAKRTTNVIKRRKTLTNQKGIIMKHIYEVNHETHEIIVTKQCLRLAGVIGSEAYRDLAQARQDYPDYPIVQREITKNSRKTAYGRLTYNEMEIHIRAKESDDTDKVLEEFERIKNLSKSYPGSYLYVKKWFLSKYADDFKEDEVA